MLALDRQTGQAVQLSRGGGRGKLQRGIVDRSGISWLRRLHGFGGLTGPDTAAIILHLLLHLGTLRPREAAPDDPDQDT